KTDLNSACLSNTNHDDAWFASARSFALEQPASHRATDDPTGGARLEGVAEGDLSEGKPQTAAILHLSHVAMLSCPKWFLHAARDLDDEVLALESTMLDLGYAAQARSLGEDAVYYTEDVPFYDDAQLNVTSQSSDARRLERMCPPDDTVAMPLDALDHYFTISPFGHHPEPIVGAGYD